MKRLFSIVAVAVLSLSSFSRAAEHGIIGIGGETVSLSDAISGIATPLINFRVAPSEIFAADLYLGVTTLSGVDSTENTEWEPSEFAFRFGVGGLVNVLYGKEADLGVYLRFSGNMSKVTLSKDDSYIEFTPVISTGFEPAYYFNKYFSMYFRTGVSMAFIPESQFLDFEGNVKTREDARLQFGTTGLALGLRYYFGG